MNQRALVLITEGAAPELLERWGVGLLPNFHRLFAQGPSGQMVGELVPYEPSGLFTAFTGRPPGEHGCFSYWAVHSPDHEPVVLEGGAARHPFLWQRPELRGRTSAIVNVFGTHPVTPMAGYCISYPMRATLHACQPRDLPVRLARAGIRPVHDVSVWFTGGDRRPFVDAVLNADRERAAAALALIDGRIGDPPDLAIVNLTSIDRLSHAYWNETEAGSPVPLEEQAVLAAYQLADGVLGELLERVDERTSVLAFSEIGFGPLRAYCSLNEVLSSAGLLVTGSDGRPDWDRSAAFEAVQGSHGVNINLTGRYKRGTVEPQDYDRVRDDVRVALLAHINPRTGAPLLADAVPRESVHQGHAVEEAPDLIVVPSDWRYLPLGDPFWSARTNRHLQSGWHRRESYWGATGPAFGGRGRPGTTLDIAPTVAAMLGLPELATGHGSPLGGST